MCGRGWFNKSALLMASAGLVWAENWPQFRGPRGDGSSFGGHGTHWELALRTPLPGPGHSSPIVWGDRVFLTAFEPETSLLSALLGSKGRLLVLCYDLRTGEQRWVREIDVDRIEKTTSINEPASPTPATDGDRLYVYFGSAGLLAFDFEGKLLWERRIGPFRHHMGSGSSPILLDDHVALNVESDGPSFLMAVDKRTGGLAWQVPRTTRQAGYSTPFVWQNKIVIAGHRELKAYRPTDGKELWTLKGLSDYVVPTPVASKQRVFVTTAGPGGNLVAAVSPDGRAAWTSSRGAAYVASPGIIRNRLFTVSAGCVVTCFDVSDGTVLWQQRVAPAGNCYSSPVLSAQQVYIVSTSGRLVSFEVTDEYRPVQTLDLHERVIASPAISGGRMIIRSDDSLFVLSPAP